MTDLEQAIRAVLGTRWVNSFAERELRRLAHEASEAGCLGVLEKIREYKSGKIHNLNAELRFGCTLSQHLQSAAEFQDKDRADIRFRTGGLTCLLEVVHKSDPSAWAATFHPEPSELNAYRLSNDNWKQAAFRLNEVLERLAVVVYPEAGAEFLQSMTGYPERACQEEACGGVAGWLAGELERGVETGHLLYPDGPVRFEIEAVGTRPGYVAGVAPLEAWVLSPGDMLATIERKATKAAERLEAERADCYLIGLVIENAWASTGDELLSALLGPLISRSGRRQAFRPVPSPHRHLVADAVVRGRRELLRAARFDEHEDNRTGLADGFFFRGHTSVGGIVALYYTDEGQFVPNPFTETPIEGLCAALRWRLEPSVR